MNKSSISSTATTTPTPPALLLQRPITSATSTSCRITPAIIPLDYNYSTMSPSTYHSRHSKSASRQAPDVDVDIDIDPSQYSSLFGDPVPPPQPTDFQFSFRPTITTSIDIASSEEEQPPFGRTVTMSTHSRLFSDVPYSSSISRRFSNNSSIRNYDVLPLLKPPDIQILPNSSGGSSSEPRDSPNYALLTPDDILRRPAFYDISEPGENVLEMAETISVSDATGRREYSEATRRVSSFAEDFKSNVGSFSHSQMTDQSSPTPPPPPLPKSYARQCSNESYSSNEWFRPATHDFPEFSKMPKMRPSSKNVISIKRDEMSMQHSPVAAMINDSNGSSSGGEERLLDTTQTLEHPTVSLDALAPARPPDPSPTLLREMNSDLLVSPPQYLKQRRKSTFDGLGQNFPPPLPPAAPPPSLPPTTALEEYELEEQEPEQNEEEPQSSIKREMSPVILKDLVATGGDYRIDQPRLHKKSSFTIITDRSAQSSRAQSPNGTHRQKSAPSTHPTKEQTTTSSSSVTKPIAKPRYHLQRKSLTSMQLKLPHLSAHPAGVMTSDDSPRPSVQFNMTGRHSPSRMPQKGILQYRESFNFSQDTPLPMQRRRSSTLPTAYDPKVKSSETLPFITDPYRTAIPRLYRSNGDLGLEPAIFPPGALPRPLKPNPNPTRQQRGLLRIINSADSMSRIPLRSNWTSMDDLLVQEKLRRPSLSPLSIQNRRRSSSTSPERRSSTLTASDRRSSNLSTVTTSDFSFRRPSLTQQPQRRKSITTGESPKTPRRQSILPDASPATKRRPSIVPPSNFGVRSRTPRTKIAKPTTLSPIIGTPNKDSSSPQSPNNMAALSLAASETLSDVTSRRDSLSKIPIRNGVTSVTSQANSRMNSQPGSRVHSRSSSPLKDFTAQLPLSGRTSRATSSRSPSRATVRSTATSRATSRAPSRSTSRASTRPISRGPPSRTSSRPNSRIDLTKELTNSRSNSRLSMTSIGEVVDRIRAGSVSPSIGIRGRRRDSIVPDRRQSISLSPHAMRLRPVGNDKIGKRRGSISPPSKARAKSRNGIKIGGKASGVGKPTALEQRRNSRSRIPTRATSGVGTIASKESASKSPPKSKGKTKLTPSPSRKTPVPQRKQPSSAKKAPGSVQKPESSVKRTPSSVGKQATAVKKQPSNLQKTGTAAAAGGTQLKRETSNLQKKPPIPSRTAGGKIKSVKREPSSISVKKTPTTSNGLKKEVSSKNLKKVTNTKPEATIAKNEGKVDVTAEKLPVAVSESNVAASTTNSPTPNHTVGGGGGGVAKLKRQVSNVSLIRLGSRISLQNKKRSDSPLSGKITEEAAINDINGKPISMTTAAVTAQVTSSMANQHLAMSAEDTSSAASTILEKSQKTLENIQQKVTDATDDIHKTINENLTDLKSMEQDMGKVSDGATSPTSSITTVVENRSGKTGASVSRGGTAEDTKKSNNVAAQVVKENSGGGVGGGEITAASATGAKISSTTNSSPLPPTQPIEAAVSVLNIGEGDATERVSARAISVLPEVDSESANFQNYEFGLDDKSAGIGTPVNAASSTAAANFGVGHVNSVADPSSGNGDDFKADIKRRSPDGQGESATGSGGRGRKTGSQEFLEEKDDEVEPPRGCCRCCTKFCMPCRRSARCSRCCRRNKKTKLHDESEEPVLSATSSATTTNLEVIDETKPQPKKPKTSCWQKLNCCKRCRKKPPSVGALATEEMAIVEQQPKMETIREEATEHMAHPAPATGPAKQSKCGLCLSKVFCCRSVNKVETTTGAETEVKKCCFCIPCRRKRAVGAAATGRGSAVGSVDGGGVGSAAWQDPEAGIIATDASVLQGAEATPKQGCCKRFWRKLLCCCYKKQPTPVASESRRASMKAPPPPAEDTRRKLHVDLVEYNSKMKGAIPVLPLWLAWFCAICNMVFPGLGTLLSGLFCLCVGIPRFSHYDSAKARVGALIINIIVAVSQFFCVLFCLVGWGWSIWWGTIMIKCARKLSKIKKVERLEMEEEKRQAELAAAAPPVTAVKVTTKTPPTVQPPAEMETAAAKP